MRDWARGKRAKEWSSAVHRMVEYRVAGEEECEARLMQYCTSDALPSALTFGCALV